MLNIRCLILLGLFLLPSLTFSQASKNVSNLGQLTYTEDLSDIWGYADGLNEYALVGVRNGFSIVDVTNPASPNELFFVPGASSTWRDVKVWDGYAYVTNEQAGGLLIVNLNYLPDSIQTSTWNGSGNVNFTTAHNIFIDEQGYGYIVGADHGRGGAIVVDLFTTPGTPILKTVYDENYIHDCFVRGDTLWGAEINRGWFSVVDMSDKSPATIPSSKVMATHNTPNNFTHNLWLSDDGNYLYTTDERSNAFIAGYDVSDLGNIEEVDRIRSNPGSGVIPHNTFFHNNFLVTAYYRDGITLVDAHRPHNLIETGYYDSSPLSGNGFNGAWGVYPYLPSGNILATDIEEGLFILGSEYPRACYLEGMVTDTFSGNPVNGVNVEIVATDASEQTGLLGDYATGLADSGMYDVTFFKVGYRPKTISGVGMDFGQVTQLNVQLRPLIPISVSGQVIDSVTGQGIPNAQVALINGDTSYYLTCDNQGKFSTNNVYTDVYDVYAGAWGHQSKEWKGQLLNNQTGQLTLEINEGYYDDFLFDFGWNITTSASTGKWQWGEPIGTYNGPQLVNPEYDIPNDLRDLCYVTGNGGGGVGDDDIDDGSTTLLSPLFDLSNEPDPFLKFHYWFFDGFGFGNPNDYLEAWLTNGVDTVLVHRSNQTEPDMGEWNEVIFRITDSLTPTNKMQLWFVAADNNPGHVVEAAIDGFEIIPGSVLLPQIGFSSDVYEGCMPLTVQFYIESAQFDDFHWELEGTDSVIYRAMDPLVTYDTAGLYDVKLVAENQFGEDSVISAGFIEVISKPTVNYAVVNATTIVSTNGSIEINPTDGNPPYTYQWDQPGFSDTNFVANLSIDTYSVVITNGFGCVDTFSFIVDSEFPAGINETNLDLQVAPNPFSDAVLIRLELAETATLRVVNIAGQIIKEMSIPAGESNTTLSDFPTPGMYFLEIQNGDQRLTKPIIYQR